MVCQDDVLNSLNKYNLKTIPRTLLINGDYGSGRHTLINNLISNLNISLIDITNNLNQDTINNITCSPDIKAYLIDTDILNEKQQNMLLKTTEEPLRNTILILLTTNIVNLIPTLLSRCFQINMNKYTKESLTDFIPTQYIDFKDIILNSFNTPGKILKLKNNDFKAILELSTKIVEKIKIASLANTLTLVNKINFKDDYTKLDLYLMLDTIIYISFNRFKETHSNYYYIIFKITSEFNNLFKNKLLNKEQLFLNYLDIMWEKTRGI